MAFCTQCGNSLTSNMRFCPNCGSQVAAAEPLANPQASSVNVNTYAHQSTPQYVVRSDYKVILLNCGTCRITDAVPLLEDILGYNAAQARNLLRVTPTEIAQNLTMEQAQYIAQALTEYGMVMAITNAAGDFFDTTNMARSSVFDASGNFLPAIAGALAMLSVANRVHRITRWSTMGPPPPVFRLGFHRPEPRSHFRRSPLHRLFMRPPAPKPIRPAKPIPHSPRPQGGPGMSKPRPPAGPRPTGGPRRPQGQGPSGSGFRGGGFGGRR